jgi:hypothetical protein
MPTKKSSKKLQTPIQMMLTITAQRVITAETNRAYELARDGIIAELERQGWNVSVESEDTDDEDASGGCTCCQTH